MVGDTDAAIPRHDGRQEPVCAAYRKTALPVITASIDAEKFKMSEMTNRLRVTWLDGLNANEFTSLNTPEEVRSFTP